MVDGRSQLPAWRRGNLPEQRASALIIDSTAVAAESTADLPGSLRHVPASGITGVEAGMVLSERRGLTDRFRPAEQV